MTTSRRRGPSIVDTDVYSSLLVPGSKLAVRYQSLIVARQTFISFQTEAEIRFGSIFRSSPTATPLDDVPRLRVERPG